MRENLDGEVPQNPDQFLLDYLQDDPQSWSHLRSLKSIMFMERLVDYQLHGSALPIVAKGA